MKIDFSVNKVTPLSKALGITLLITLLFASFFLGSTFNLVDKKFQDINQSEIVDINNDESKAKIDLSEGLIDDVYVHYPYLLENEEGNIIINSKTQIDSIFDLKIIKNSFRPSLIDAGGSYVIIISAYPKGLNYYGRIMHVGSLKFENNKWSFKDANICNSSNDKVDEEPLICSVIQSANKHPQNLLVNVSSDENGSPIANAYIPHGDTIYDLTIDLAKKTVENNYRGIDGGEKYLEKKTELLKFVNSISLKDLPS